MFLAGSQTVQNTTTNTITTMCFEPEIKAKLLAEIDPIMESVKDDV